MNLRDLASEILEQQDELHYLRCENAKLREHNDFLMKHIVDANRASELQLHGWITGLIDGSLSLNGETKP